MLQVLAGALAITAAAALAHNASAHTDTCAAGQSAVVGTTTCVNNADLEFRDWCQNSGTITSDPRRCHIVYDYMGSTQSKCVPYTHVGFFPSGPNAGKIECRNDGQTACAAREVYSAAMHACAPCPADAPLVEDGVCVASCSGDNLEEDGVCVASCSAGNAPSPGGTYCMTEAEARAAATCGGKFVEAARRCDIPVSPRDGATSIGCHLGGSGTPQCADVFGADLNIPSPSPIDGEYVSLDNGFVYNCGDGASPRTVNPRHHRTCFCDGSSGFFGNYPACGCSPGRVLNDAGDSCDVCTGGQAESEGACVDECPTGEEAVDGICDVPCTDSGQRRVHSLVHSAFSACVPLSDARALAECESAGWSARDGDSGTTPISGVLRCGIPSNLYGAGSNIQGTCWLRNGDEPLTDADIPCLKIYGNPPVYPRAVDHPDVVDRSDLDNLKFFVSHCAVDKDGNAIAGGWPPAANEDGATACGCDSENGYGGAWPNCAVCGYNRVVDGNYGACEACSVGFAHGDECVSECPTGYEGLNGGCACSGGLFLDGTSCVSECPAGEYPVDGVSCSALSDAEVTTALHAEIRKDAPDTGLVRSFLKVADADGTLDGVALLITAAALGHAEVVSVLITAGADPDTRSPFGGFDLNIPLLMATYDGTQQPDGSGELARAKRATVLYHFGDAVEVRGTLYHNWNLIGNGNHFSDLLGFSEDREPPESDPILQEMADYALTRGMHCGHIGKNEPAKRYGKYCAGTLGAAMAAAVNAGGSGGTVSIVAAAISLTEAGVSLLVAGDPTWGGIVQRAAFNGNAAAVSILITFGADAEVPDDVRGAPHQAARTSAWNPTGALNVLRHLIGGLSVAGKLSAYGSWNKSSDLGRPLEIMNDYSSLTDEASQRRYDEMHSLFYDYGSRCPAAGGGYCQVPAQTITLTARTTGTVAAVSRAPLGFRSLPATVLASLSVNGWSATVHSDVSPHRFVVSRTRVQPVEGGDAAAVFTLTMTSAATSDADSRYVMISLVAAPHPAHAALVSSVLEGEVVGAHRWLATLGAHALTAQTGDAPPVPLLIAAAMRGRAAAVSVLVTFGFDPDARSSGFPPLNVPLLMAAHIGAIQADGTELPRADKWNVLRHFGDAVKVRGTLFDWNDPPASNFHVSRRLDNSRSAESADPDSAAILLQMADYMLARGMNCEHEGINLLHRYDAHCIGSYGAALVPLINGGHSPSDAAVRTAAQAMVDAGIPLDVAGHTDNGHLIPRAAVQGHAGALSILVTFGMDPEARVGGDGTAREWQALHRIVVRLVGANDSQIADRYLGVLRAFIGGMSVAGRLESFNGWSAEAHYTLLNDKGAPLDFMQVNNPDPYDATLESHALLYEYGARCVLSANAAGRFCEVPFDEHPLPPGPRLRTGGVLTMTARALSDFQTPPIAAGVSATLDANGWSFSRNTIASPNELTLSRVRPASSTDSPALFTVTLTSAAGEASREMRVSQEATPPEYDELVTAILAGDVEDVVSVVMSNPELVDSSDENGVPILIVAATLGRPDVVSVLIEAGADPEARQEGTEWTALHHIADSVRGNATMALESLNVFIGGLEAAGKLESFAGWNLTAGSDGRPLDVFHAAAVAGSDSAAKDEMHQLFFRHGAECESPGALRYCAPPLEEHSFLEVGATGPVVTLSGLGVAGEAFVLPDGARRAELRNLGWVLESEPEASPPIVVLVRETGGVAGEAAVTVEATLRTAAGRDLRAYSVEASVVEFAIDCAALNRAPAEANVCGGCLAGFVEDGGLMCAVLLVTLTYGATLDAVLPGVGGTVAGGTVSSDVESGASVAFGTLVTLTATPEEGYFIYKWRGAEEDCDGGDAETTGAAGELMCVVEAEAAEDVLVLFRLAVLDCDAAKRLPGSQGRTDLCGDCAAGYGAVGDYCVPVSGVYDESIPQRDICLALGGRLRANDAVCAGVDADGTFCILDSVGAFPCRGLFRRVLLCNLAHNREALNPFICGRFCAEDQAVGGSCN